MTQLPDAASLNLDPDCELFRKGDPSFHSITALARIFIPSACVIMGVGTHLLFNYMNKRPYNSSAHRYLIYAGIGVVVGEWITKKRNEFMAEKDLQYYHYMTLHPEDFQAPERVKYKNYLTGWHAFR